ncbi:TfuA-like protein [Labrys monachus]|uniref:TfuA-like core domain-containing protein n=1 Tax=Labrys monachus TaxID=217067 RepID=A0ABU0FQI7_9HYPH|nr:TfuA-like protein [Labrys monachus]MDQ0396330.1 hypothetical protein [Labrys monachus]
MRMTVFAGPSLYGIDEGFLDDFDMLPPAGCGDVLAAVAAGAPAIGLIDGVFGHAPSVWHKEILHAISEGIPVYGAAGIGALRGAECTAFGMIGVGRIFSDYVSGRRVADADVSVAYAPRERGYAPLTVAMVDVEATVEAIGANSVLSPGACRALLRAAQRIHFEERTWPDIIFEAVLADSDAVAAQEAVNLHARSQKCEDALLMLGRMREDAGSRVRSEPDFTFVESRFFSQLRHQLETGSTG